MNIFLKSFVLTLFLLNGCSQKRVDTLMINNLSSSKELQVSPPTTRYVNDLLEVSVEIKNLSKNSYADIMYRFKWLDQERYELGENLSTWQPLFIEAKDAKRVTQLAPSPKAERYKFYIKDNINRLNVKRVDPNSLQDLDRSYGAEDLHIFTHALVSSMLGDKMFEKNPTIAVGKVKNNTDEIIETSSIVNSVKTLIIKSKKAKFIDPSMRDMINSELEYQNSSKYINKNSSKKIGRQIAPDYILDGVINSIKKGDDFFYVITMQLHNIESGTIDWSEFKEVRKIRKQHER